LNRQEHESDPEEDGGNRLQSPENADSLCSTHVDAAVRGVVDDGNPPSDRPSKLMLASALYKLHDRLVAVSRLEGGVSCETQTGTCTE
jgi:hypothetical protein